MEHSTWLVIIAYGKREEGEEGEGKRGGESGEGSVRRGIKINEEGHGETKE